MNAYPDELTARDGRSLYFESGGIPADGGYSGAWVKLMVGPIPLGFPNSEARRRAVKLHDLHHVLTGYGTTWTGEAEISAWEIASGCGPYTAAWVINLGGLFIGLLVNPRRTRRAFLRGRGARNLYHGEPFSEALLDEKLGDIRARLAFDAGPCEVDRLDRASWIAWATASIANAVFTVGVVAIAVTAVFRWAF
jgi:hypothetical protein